MRGDLQQKSDAHRCSLHNSLAARCLLAPSCIVYPAPSNAGPAEEEFLALRFNAR